MKRLIKSSDDIDYSSIPESNKHGDCFKVAFETMQKDPKNRILVHAIVTGQGDIEGIEYSHAFVIDESRDVVIDNTVQGPQKEFNTNLYYYIGKISISREYDAKSAYEHILDTKQWGPWDSEILSKCKGI